MSHAIRKTRTRGISTRTLTFDFLEPRLCLSSYTTVDLVPLPGHDYSIALGVNDNSMAVGRSTAPNGGERVAVVWSVDSLGDASVAQLPGIGGQPSENAMEVNNQGTIAGSALAPPETPGGDSHLRAAVWTGAFGSHNAHDLGTLGEEYVWSGASSISEPDVAGNIWVAGGSGNDIDDNPRIYRGVLWQIGPAGNVLSIIDLEPSSNNVYASDVRVIGDSVFVAGDVAPGQACIWEVDLNGVVQSRTDLGTDEFEAVRAFALNHDGDVVGTGFNAAHEYHGFLDAFPYETGTGSITDLGSLGNQGSRAEGISDSGVVVGSYYDVQPPNSIMVGDEHAFVWEDGTMHTLLDQVSNRTFWRLFSAFDVNNRGEIVGNGRAGKRNDSQEHGFLARPEGLAENPAPEANPDDYTVQPGTTLTVAAPGVLANDTDADGDALTAVLDAGPTSGTLSLASDGSFTYTPNSGFIGEDSFTYVANDGTTDSNVATVKIQVTSKPAANTHVGDLNGSVVDLGRFWQADVTIAVVDGAGNPVANATVNGTWSGDTSGSASAVTDPAGVVTVSSAKILDKKDTAIFTVDSVVHDSFDYDPGANEDPDGDSDGTTITVYQGGSAMSSMLAAGDSQTVASEPSMTNSTSSISTQDTIGDDTPIVGQQTAADGDSVVDEAASTGTMDEAFAELEVDLLGDELLEELVQPLL